MAITPGKSYYVKVAAFLEDESYKEIEGAPSAPVEVITTPGSVTASITPTKVTKEQVFVFAWYSGTVGVTCSQKKYVDGYEWAVYTADSSKSKKIKTFTIKGMCIYLKLKWK